MTSFAHHKIDIFDSIIHFFTLPSPVSTVPSMCSIDVEIDKANFSKTESRTKSIYIPINNRHGSAAGCPHGQEAAEGRWNVVRTWRANNFRGRRKRKFRKSSFSHSGLASKTRFHGFHSKRCHVFALPLGRRRQRQRQRIGQE